MSTNVRRTGGKTRGRAHRSSKSGFGSVQQLPSGRWQARYASPMDGKRVAAPRTFDDRATAWAWLARERPLTEDPWSWVAPKDRLAASLATKETFGPYADRWLAQRTQLKPRTQEEYARLLRLLAPGFANSPVDRISRTSVKAWYASFCPDRPTQRARAYSLLRTIMDEAVADGVVMKNPVDISGAATAERVRHIRTLSQAQLVQLADAMPEQWKALVYVSTLCMLRMGEAFELRRGDIDLSAPSPVIRVERAVSRVNVGGRMTTVIGTPKSKAGIRSVLIHDDVAEILEEHLATFVGACREDLVFPSAAGRHLSPSTLYGKAPTENTAGRGFYRARVVAGVPDLNWHALRHSGAVFLSHCGATVAEMMLWLGHSSPGIAMRYQHVAGGRPAQNVAKLSRLIQIPTAARQLSVPDDEGHGEWQ